MSARASRRPSCIAAPRLPADVFPIADPDLARLSELLHRMSVCAEDTPATRMAGEGIRVLRKYVAKQANN